MPVKAVLDTNIWISALITAGAPEKLVEAWLAEGSFTVVYPQWLIDELLKVPSKSRLRTSIVPIQVLAPPAVPKRSKKEKKDNPLISRIALDGLYL